MSTFWSVPLRRIFVPKFVIAIPILSPENLVIYCDPASIAIALADAKDIDSWMSFN